MIGTVASFVAKSALMQSPVGAFLRWVPAWAWKALAIVAVLLGFYLWHGHAVTKALSAADKAGYERRAAEDAKALVELLQRARTAEATAAAISADERKKNDEASRAVRSSAADLSMRGPGASSADRRCESRSGLSAPAGGPQPSVDAGNVAGALLSVDDRLAERADVPWRWLVARAEQCDLDRAEVIAWRNNYQRQAAEWKKLYGDKPPSK